MARTSGEDSAGFWVQRLRCGFENQGGNRPLAVLLSRTTTHCGTAAEVAILWLIHQIFYCPFCVTDNTCGDQDAERQLPLLAQHADAAASPAAASPAAASKAAGSGSCVPGLSANCGPVCAQLQGFIIIAKCASAVLCLGR
jgi:hypothetical protein